MDIYSTFEGQELTASEFRRTFSISESASIQDESFPTIRVFQSRQSILNLNFLKIIIIPCKSQHRHRNVSVGYYIPNTVHDL